MAHLQLIDRRSSVTDDEIREIAASHPRDAADLVIRKHRDNLFRHAAGIVKDYELALDVIQEVFIKAMKEPRFFNPEFKMKAWLYRVTTNLCFNIVRNRKRRAAILETVPQPKSTAPRQNQVVYRTQQQAALAQAMSHLSESHRTILMLRFYSDLSYAEIAESLDIKLGTVMSRLSRAKSRLAEVLEGVEGLMDTKEA